MLEVSPEDARTALSAVHGFTSMEKGREGTLAIFARHQCVQSDPIEVAGRNADLTLQSRVYDYKQEYLYDLLYKEHQLFESFCKMHSILPIEKYPYFHWLRTRSQKRHAPFFSENERETAFILKLLDEGPVSSRDIKGWKKVKWWGETSLSRVILERLWACGKVMIHHREGAVKYYVLSENVVPERLRWGAGNEECAEEIVHIITRASRLVSPSRALEQWYAVGKTQRIREILEVLEKKGELFSFSLSGFKGKVYSPMEDTEIWEDPPQVEDDYVRFLAPLDPLNWNRALFEAVYGMEYRWEVYKKEKDRVYGYYCLPILFNGRMVGLMEPLFKKKEKVLEIRNMHVLDETMDRERLKRAVEEELERFREYVGAERIEMKKWG